ncbi:serine/threonine-protein kinase [Nocardiopsis sp. MG754419]|uniref:serine/threonine-protein kinase n=1 Tax=Nocardiopsis sp. MG754419 TaxID=2259865 RepID=UPI001BA7C1C7|nr:serine/threonine-protein kinase [Nocardiopsis sp. MG754419]MBR8745313.1 serine/threonine protein kinase [Nocardiopsis sp. MG754419]
MRQPAPHDPREVGPYRVLALLGSGGMGRVYLGTGPDGTPAAIKVVRAEYAYDPGFREGFARELELARRVHGDYTPRVLDADTSGQTPWLATEYVMGPSLQDLVSGAGPLPEESVRFMARGIAQALERVHATGLVHRDLKPGNVMVAAEGPQVIDFGIAHALGDSQETDDDDARFVGTPAFMSPEAVEGETNPGSAADVFALGGTLVYALTGRAPFGDGHPSTVLYRIGHLEPDLDEVPASLRGIIEACLDKDPAARPDATRVLHALGGPVAPAPAAAAWLPPAAAARLDGVAHEYHGVITSAPVSGGKGIRGGRALIGTAATVALALVAGLGVWTAGEAARVLGPGEGSDDGSTVARRETCDPGEHLAPEFTEAAKDEPTAPNNVEGAIQMEFSHDGNVLVVAGNGGLALWDWREQTELALIETDIPMPYGYPHFGPDDCRVAYASDDGAHVYHLESGEHTVFAEGYDIGSVAFTDDGTRLVVGSIGNMDAPVLIYDLETGDLDTTLTGGPVSVHALDVSPDGAHVIAQDYTSGVHVWNVESGEIVAEGTDSPQLNPKGVSMVDDTEILRPLTDGARRVDFTASSDATDFVDEDMDAEEFRVHDVRYSREADRVYITYVPVDFSFEEAYMKVWEFSTGEDLTADGNEGFMHEIAVHPEGEVLVGVPAHGNAIWFVDPIELRLVDQI